MNFQVRRAQAGDAAEIVAILRDLHWFAHLDAEAPPVTEERVARHLEMCIADASHSVYVATDPGDRVVGYVSVHWLPYLFLRGPEGYVSELFLHGSARGQELGGALLETVKGEARERGCCRLSLVNSRSRESYRRGFYVKRGWRERSEVANFVYPLEEES